MRLPSLILLVGLGCVAGCGGTFYRDKNGFPHGTGEAIYYYDSGPVMLREDYVLGKLHRSRWFAPTGAMIQETEWKDECGEGIYLRQDGSIRSRVMYVKGVAEGPTTYYDASGNVTKVVEFKNGRPVEK
jgi:antitoxin component YwqK of YwqJK toxin-antitoxin module